MRQTLSVLSTEFANVFDARSQTLTAIHASNNSASPVNISVCEVGENGLPGITNALLWEFEIPANDFIEFGSGINFAPAHVALHAKASVASVVTIKISAN